MEKNNIYASWDPDVAKRFKSWQLRTIVVSMIGYAIYYFVRKNFSLAMPGLTAQYGISNTSFGIVIGIGSLIYGFSRFANGFIVDKFSARTIMAIGLLLCALSNFAFGWGVNISAWITGVSEGPDLINMLILVMGITIVLNQAFQGGISTVRASAALLDTSIGTRHKDVDMEHLPLHRCRSCSNRLRLHHGLYGYRPQQQP